MTSQSCPRLSLLLSLLLVGCGSSPPPRSAQPTPDPVVGEDGAGPSRQPEEAPTTGPIVAPDAKRDVTRCDEAATHIVSLLQSDMKDVLEGMTPDDRARATAEMEQKFNHAKISAGCARVQFSDAQLDCIMAARIVDDIASCEDPGLAMELPPDPVAAYEWAEKLCTKGDPESCIDLGTMLTFGVGVGKDLARARASFQQACDQNIPAGCTILEYLKTPDYLQCDLLVDHVSDLMRASFDELFADLSPEDLERARADVEAQLSPVALLRDCLVQKITKTQGACLLKATSMGQLDKCM